MAVDCTRTQALFKYIFMFVFSLFFVNFLFAGYLVGCRPDSIVKHSAGGAHDHAGNVSERGVHRQLDGRLSRCDTDIYGNGLVAVHHISTHIDCRRKGESH